jgi:hypothetical protein
MRATSKWVVGQLAMCLFGASVVGGCAATGPKQAKTALIDEMRAVGYEPFSPPRTSALVGTIISYDSQGREVIEAEAATCFDGVAVRGPYDTEYLKNSWETLTSAGLGASAAQLSKNVADFSFAANASSDVKVDIHFTEPKVSYFEKLVVEQFIENLKNASPDSACFKKIIDSKNIVVLHVMSVNGLEYSFTDKSDHSIKLTAELMQKAKISPELQKKVDGQSTLTVTAPMVLGYRAFEARKSDGAITGGLVFSALSPADISARKTDASRKDVK